MADILIIEDNALLRRACAKQLSRAGHGVREAEDGRRGLAEMDSRQPDLVLLDLLMPRVDGFAVLTHIKERGYAFPVIVLTNVLWNLDKEGCRKIGVTDYFIKSKIDIPTLIQKIEQHLPRTGASTDL